MEMNIQDPNCKCQRNDKIRIIQKIFLGFVIGVSFVIFHSSFGCASVAGEFYPADKGQLSRDIDTYLKEIKVIREEGDLLAIIVPHAGYQFSGLIAGAAYKQ